MSSRLSLHFPDGVQDTGWLLFLQGLGRRELSDCLGALRDSVLGKLTREDEPDSSLDLSGAEYTLVIVSDEATSFRGDLLEGVINERVHDRHRSLGNAHLRVDLLQDLNDVRGVRLGSLSRSLLLVTSLLLNRLSNFLSGHSESRVGIALPLSPCGTEMSQIFYWLFPHLQVV